MKLVARASLALIVGIFACSSDEGDREDPEAVAVAFRDAISDERLADACELLTGEFKREIEDESSASCEDAWNSIGADERRLLEEAELKDRQVAKDAAQFSFEGDEGLIFEVELSKVSDAWFVSALNDNEEGESADSACEMERKTIEAAAAAFCAINGEFPSTSSELVEADLIRDPMYRWTINTTAGGATVTGVASDNGTVPSDC